MAILAFALVFFFFIREPKIYRSNGGKEGGEGEGEVEGGLEAKKKEKISATGGVFSGCRKEEIWRKEIKEMEVTAAAAAAAGFFWPRRARLLASRFRVCVFVARISTSRFFLFAGVGEREGEGGREGGRQESGIFLGNSSHSVVCTLWWFRR